MKNRILFDTSVLVAAMVATHLFHNRAILWLQRAKQGQFAFLVATHSIAELYSILTTLPVRPCISPPTAQQLINDNIESCAEIISLDTKDYIAVTKELSNLGLSGGIVFDALLLQAAKKAKADRLLTFNLKDFERLNLSTALQVVEP